MADSIFDELVKASAEGRDAKPDALQKLAKIYGAESRAADEVAPRAIVGRFRYVPGLGWLEWDGRRWVDGPAGEERAREAVRQFIDLTEKNLRAEVIEIQKQIDDLIAVILVRAPADRVKAAQEDPKSPEKAIDALVKEFATKEEVETYNALATRLWEARTQAEIWLNLLQESKIGNITKLCRRIDGVLTLVGQLDQHHDLLNCLNGIVDLRTGQLWGHNPDLLITQITGAAYDPQARCPRWDQALHAIDPDALEWFQIRVGQAFTGYTPDDDSLTLSDGGGENGKSTVMAGITRAAGTYFTLVSDRALLAQPGQHPTEMMDFLGARVALMEETPEEGRLDTHQLKAIVGTPKMKARRMRQDPVEWSPTHTLFVNTNHLPQVDATDHGTWRRLKRMSWPYKFIREPTETNDRKGDKTLRPYIQHGPGVAEAVLAWAVQGAVKWYAQRADPMDDPQAVQAAGRDWRAQSDVGFQFVRDHLIADPQGFVVASVMRAAFEGFLQDQNKHAWSAQLMNTRLPDSMAEAGIRLAARPDRISRVREGDCESWPPLPVNPWPSSATPARTPTPVGKAARMWRGVRFKTSAEQNHADGEPTLKAV